MGHEVCAVGDLVVEVIGAVPVRAGAGQINELPRTCEGAILRSGEGSWAGGENQGREQHAGDESEDHGLLQWSRDLVSTVVKMGEDFPSLSEPVDNWF